MANFLVIEMIKLMLFTLCLELLEMCWLKQMPLVFALLLIHNERLCDLIFLILREGW